MTSSVFFKFKSQKEPTRVEFDGTGISVFELKRDIILQSGLGDGTDFDLAIYNEDGKDEYDDDTTVIPRSTTVVARRLPASKPGAGRAARYVSGRMPVMAKNNSRREQAPKAATKAISTASAQMQTAITEEEKMAAMFQAEDEQWTAQQEEMAKQAPVFGKGGPRKQQQPVPDHEPPAGYVCYRCNQKGHWIQQCPTNDDPDFDNKPRVKRTTGIPKSFLKTVDKETIMAQAGADEDVKAPSGVMMNSDGDFVVVEPDKAAWQQFQAKTNAATASKAAAAKDEKELSDRGILCSIDKKMFIEPMKTPCCATTYCNDCITNALIEGDLVCPGCQSEGVLIDDLKPDAEMKAKITAYLEEKSTAGKAKDNSSNPSTVKGDAKDNQSAVESERADSASPSNDIAAKSPKVEGSPSSTPKLRKASPDTNGKRSDSKKRVAEDSAENNKTKIPKGPKAAMNGPQQQQMPANMMDMMNQMNAMSGMNGFQMPGMPFGGMMPNMMGGMMNMGGFPGMNMNGFPNMVNPVMMGGTHGFNGNGNGNGFGNSNMQFNRNGGYNNNNNNNNQQRVMNGNGNATRSVATSADNNGGYKQMNFTQPNGDDEAYFRKPVNPHRHQNRQRRQRPSDYREL